jgi:two-component system sensor histidine kinase DesK
MRRYVTWSFVALAAFTTLVVVVTLLAEGAPAGVLVGASVAGGLVTAHSFWWEHRAPLWLSATTLVVSYAVWSAVPLDDQNALLLFPLGLTVGYVTTTRSGSWRWVAGAVLVTLVPVVVVGAGDPVRVLATSIAVLLAMLSLYAACRLNRYGFDLYLEIDAARETQSELAVMRERYRFSVDLHDIQGQALHVSRLQLQLADKTLDRDPAVARRHLREAEQLIVQTIAETRRLAYGERTLTLAGELANSAELIRAAGIALDVTGVPPVGHRADDLFGHVVREATTNVLRHAQAEQVTITLGPESVEVVNDGAADPLRALSGLARLGERFAEVGGTVTTRLADGRFRVEARATAETAAAETTAAAGGATRAAPWQEGAARGASTGRRHA